MKFILIVKSDKHIADNTHIIEKSDILERSCNSAVIYNLLRLSGEIFSVQNKLACFRRVNTRQKVEDCGFTCTVGADKSVKLFFLYFNIDVYKRQVIGCIILALIFAIFTYETLKSAKDTRSDEKAVISSKKEIRTNAVSYTHLDVYKRQVRYMMNKFTKTAVIR